MDFIYRHIESIMTFLGVEHYFYEAVSIHVNPNHPAEIEAHGEFYFLVGMGYVSLRRLRGFVLISAENTIAELDSEANVANGIHTDHFTGQISISLKPYGYLSGRGNLQGTLDGKCALNFIRVIPCPK